MFFLSAFSCCLKPSTISFCLPLHMPMLLQEHECQKIFRDFYRGASNWLQTAQELMRFIDGKAEGEMADGSDSAGEAKVFYDTIVTPAFFASDGGKSCSSIVSTIAAECSALTSGVKTASGDGSFVCGKTPFSGSTTSPAHPPTHRAEAPGCCQPQ